MTLISASGYEVRRQAWLKELEQCVKNLVLSHKPSMEEGNILLLWPELDNLVECYERGKDAILSWPELNKLDQLINERGINDSSAT